MALAADQFVHLHLHTQYSMLDGVNKIPDVLKQAQILGQKAIAMTDHGNLHGALEFYLAGKKLGIKPIIGCELYVTPSSRFERKTRSQGGGGTFHLTVLAQNLIGYRNLCKLVTLAYKEGFYFKPRVDHELLEQYGEGLVALSGCLAGELSHHIGIDDEKGAKELVEFYGRTFNGRFFLEIQPHPLPEQQKLNEACAHFAKAKSLPLVATTDCHYSTVADHYAQEVLMCISTGKHITDPDRLRHDGMRLHLKSAEEMVLELQGCSYAEEALNNSVAIADSCELEFDFSNYYMPQFDAGDDKRPLIEIMAEMARDGLKKRLEMLEKTDRWDVSQRQVYEQRLEDEIGLIDKMGFAGYFLVVSDFIVWAKEQGIPVGPGRGSAAGSLVAYSLRITEVDPIVNKLLFERFLNPERVSLPDIDVDFCVYGRDRVIQYVVEKYGKDRVAQIGTFGKLKAKAALKDVGRALGLSYAETDRIAQLIPAPRQGFDFTIQQALEMESRLREYAQGDGRQFIELAQKLEGLTRHSSTHAAGVVIGDRPLVEFLPLMVDKEGHDVTQFSMNFVEKIGLVKFDFLGLKNLSIIKTAIDLIKASMGVEVDFETLSLNDKATYQLLCAGNTTGIFQLESSGITEMTMRLKPNCFNDLVAIVALYRPGPLDAGMVDHYISRKHGREKVSYLHPLMEPVLADTYGIMVYQEQVMQLVRVLAGYSLGEADLMRKAMGKKIPEEMAKQRSRFMSGAAENSITERIAAEIFSQIETFARYGFNRSHSAGYAMISFQTAYLKAHYPVEFMAALMTHEVDDSDKVLKNLNECRKQKIEVLPPDVNHSLAGFSVRDGMIRYGLSAVKGVGERAINSILQAREKGDSFEDLEDFCARLDAQALNRKAVESLVKCGAFDFCGLSRCELVDRTESVVRAAHAIQRERETNQIGLFGSSADKPDIPRRQSKQPEWPINQKLAYEREALGFYISGHPLGKFENSLKRMGSLSTAAVANCRDGAEVRVGGVVTALKLKNTKRGDRYATFTLEDSVGAITAMVWPDVYREVAQLLVADDPVLVSGKMDVNDQRVNFIVAKVESLIDLRDRRASQGLLKLCEQDDFESSLDKLLPILSRHAGKCPLRLTLDLEGGEVGLALRDRRERPVAVAPSEALCEEFERIFGRPVLFFI